MDDIVIKAMAKWPNVPAVSDWLSLERRGRWLLKGAPISNQAAVEFINRNYLSDNAGRWYFQNGPQRVFITLEYTPWIYSLNGIQELHTHTGLPATQLKNAWLDDAGDLLLLSEHGVGLLKDQDLPVMLEKFADSSGRLLDDSAQEIVIDHLLNGQSTDCYLAWKDTLLSLQPIESKKVAAYFEFDPTPKVDEV